MDVDMMVTADAFPHGHVEELNATIVSLPYKVLTSAGYNPNVHLKPLNVAIFSVNFS